MTALSRSDSAAPRLGPGALADPGARTGAAGWAAEFLAFCFGPVVFLAPLGIAALFTLFAIAALVELGRAAPIDPAAPFRRWMPAWPLVAWAAVTVLWSINPEGGLIEAAKLAAEAWAGCFVLAFAATLPEERRVRLLEAATAGLALGAVLALADTFADGHLTMWARGKAVFTPEFYSRGAAVAGVLAVPLALALAQRRRWEFVVPFALASAAAVALLAAASAKLALAAGLVGLAAGYASRRAVRVAAALGIVVAVAMPVLGRVELPPDWHCRLVGAKASAAHRLAIWRFTSDHIADHPLIGWGLDASRVLPGGQATVHLESCPDAAGGPLAVDIAGNVLPLHPHNAALQVWIELGLVGVALAAALALWAAGRAERLVRTRLDGAIVAATVLALLAVEFVSFGVWQAWWICAALMAAAFARMGLAAPAGGQDALPSSEVQLGQRVAL